MKLKSLLALFAAALTLGYTALANAQTPQLGIDYTVYSPVQPTDAGNKIEVTEFFAYTCSHCADFEPLLAPWVKKLSKDVSFRRVPVIFRPQFVPAAKIYYTLEAMNLLDKLHAAVFDAIHKEHADLLDEKALFAWVASKGVDAKQFAEIYNSFAINSKVERANQITRAHAIPGTPALVVNGKYLIASLDHDRQLKVADFLIAKIRAEKKKK
ncbi:MAG TPA: thiol:disulfide interchange protein DsbA/DsbL [Rhodocyclaceae bacterium]|nr:thiol:disulfide interchange protein DsbA/DsbL [Rhodocyclaceae bacterium]